MAQKRMFDKSITNSDKFLEMPIGSQNLYFHLSMNADDDGFVDNWKSIIRMVGAKEDDYKVLIAKSYIIPFESGVIVIKHWRINNFLRKDRHNQTKYIDEYNSLIIKDNEEYEWLTNGQPSIDKNSIVENSIEYKKEIDNNKLLSTKKKFIPPTLEEIEEYCKERKNNVDSKAFYDYFNEGNWVDSKGNKVKNWKQKIITWEKNNTQLKKKTREQEYREQLERMRKKDLEEEENEKRRNNKTI